MGTAAEATGDFHRRGFYPNVPAAVARIDKKPCAR
jgi:hypothetical protein